MFKTYQLNGTLHSNKFLIIVIHAETLSFIAHDISSLSSVNAYILLLTINGRCINKTLYSVKLKILIEILKR